MSYAKKCLMSAIVVLLNSHPIADLILLITLNLATVVITVRVSPYRNCGFLIRDIICELSFTSIHILSIFLFSPSYSRETIGLIIVVFCWIILITHTWFTIYQYYLLYKANKLL